MRGAWLDSFEFKEFEEDFENCPDRLRPFGWRRIDFPKGDHRRPPAFVIRRFGDRVFGFLRFRRCWQYGVFWDSSYAQLKGLGASGVALGASWGALGGVLGPLGRLLGRLRGDQNVTKIRCPKKANFQTPKRRVLLRYGGGFGSPKSTKIGPKTSPKLRRFSRAQKIVFKSLLEPS